jgi:hypothetical protein
VPWWRQNFGALSAATISRRDRLSHTVGEAGARDWFRVLAQEIAPARAPARRAAVLAACSNSSSATSIRNTIGRSKDNSMEIRTLRNISVFVGLFSAAGGFGCGSSPSSIPIDPAAFGEKYKIADNQINGWTEDPSGYWTGTDLRTSGIDGGNMEYDDNGFRQGMFETLNGPTPQNALTPQVCHLRAMDFGDDAHASKMFSDAVTSNAASIAIPPFDISVAAADSVIGGIKTVAHFGASYFEVTLGGYADQNSAVSDAAPFLQALQADSK